MATYWENSCSFGLRYVSWYKCLIVSLVFSHLGFWSGNLFLIAPFPDLCLLVPFYKYDIISINAFFNMQRYPGCFNVSVLITVVYLPVRAKSGIIALLPCIYKSTLSAFSRFFFKS